MAILGSQPRLELANRAAISRVRERPAGFHLLRELFLPFEPRQQLAVRQRSKRFVRGDLPHPPGLCETDSLRRIALARHPAAMRGLRIDATQRKRDLLLNPPALR